MVSGETTQDIWKRIIQERLPVISKEERTRMAGKKPALTVLIISLRDVAPLMMAVEARNTASRFIFKPAIQDGPQTCHLYGRNQEVACNDLTDFVSRRGLSLKGFLKCANQIVA
jgi:hypothetical protein